MSDNTGKGLYMAYHQAGANFLAVKLAKIFTRIESQEDMVLHNDILKDVLEIIEGEEQSFFKSLAEMILYQPDSRQKRLPFRVAWIVLNIGQKKG